MTLPDFGKSADLHLAQHLMTPTERLTGRFPERCFKPEDSAEKHDPDLPESRKVI
jgi:hypothetical protein